MPNTEINIYLGKKGLTQKRICDELGLHKSTVSLLLSGRLVLEHRLDQIAGMLKVSRRRLDSLVRGNQPSNHNGTKEKANER